jgi:glycosyltransferase involved in cell wall biosynthesis
VNIVVWHVHGSWTTASGAGCCSTDPDCLERALRELAAEPELARRIGTAARAHAPSRYGLERFLADGDTVLGAVAYDRTPVAAAMTGRR